MPDSVCRKSAADLSKRRRSFFLACDPRGGASHHRRKYHAQLTCAGSGPLRQALSNAALNMHPPETVPILLGNAPGVFVQIIWPFVEKIVPVADLSPTTRRRHRTPADSQNLIYVAGTASIGDMRCSVS